MKIKLNNRTSINLDDSNVHLHVVGTWAKLDLEITNLENDMVKVIRANAGTAAKSRNKLKEVSSYLDGRLEVCKVHSLRTINEKDPKFPSIIVYFPEVNIILQEAKGKTLADLESLLESIIKLGRTADIHLVTSVVKTSDVPSNLIRSGSVVFIDNTDSMRDSLKKYHDITLNKPVNGKVQVLKIGESITSPITLI